MTCTCIYACVLYRYSNYNCIYNDACMCMHVYIIRVCSSQLLGHQYSPVVDLVHRAVGQLQIQKSDSIKSGIIIIMT